MTRLFRFDCSAESARARRAAKAHRCSGGRRKKATNRSEMIVPKSTGGPAYPERPGGYTQPVDGLFDWYWLGVVLGLGVSDGAMGREARRPLLAVLFAAIVALAVVLALVAIAWWAILAFG